jgi:preprotein translocase subunit SecG
VVTKAIGVLWPVAMLVLAWVINRRISSDQPREVVAPFALTFAWILAAPWVFAWYTALAWVTLTQVPRNRMTRWLAIVTVVLALWLSNGGHGRGVLW